MYTIDFEGVDHGQFRRVVFARKFLWGQGWSQNSVSANDFYRVLRRKVYFARVHRELRTRSPHELPGGRKWPRKRK